MIPLYSTTVLYDTSDTNLSLIFTVIAMIMD